MIYRINDSSEEEIFAYNLSGLNFFYLKYFDKRSNHFVCFV